MQVCHQESSDGFNSLYGLNPGVEQALFLAFVSRGGKFTKDVKDSTVL